uniref:Serpentine receptor class gamma n=1 Tax=Panagrolaimus davidi TaxID=227884 RepID=A0A914NYP1_9BILA
MILEVLLVLFFLREFFKSNSHFTSSYYILLFYGCFVDLLFCPGWIAKRHDDDDDRHRVGVMEYFGIVEWYGDQWFAAWNFSLVLNKASVLMLPMKQQRIWSPLNLTLLIIFTLIFPFIINAASLYEPYCIYLHIDAIRCPDFQYGLLMRVLIVNCVSGIAGIILVFVAVKMSQSTSSASVKCERRLLITATVSSILLGATYFFYAVGYFLSLQPDNMEAVSTCYNFGDVMFLFQHYGSIALVLVIVPKFRHAFYKFCSFGKWKAESFKTTAITLTASSNFNKPLTIK